MCLTVNKRGMFDCKEEGCDLLYRRICVVGEKDVLGCREERCVLL